MFRFLCFFLCLVGSLCTAAVRSASPEEAAKETAKARLEVARKGLAEAEKVIPGMSEDSANIWIWSKRVLHAELACSTSKSERITALEAHWRRAVRLEKLAEREYMQGRSTRLILLEAVYRRLNVEAHLAGEKAKPELPRR